jgi:aminoglycoside phosphotransferase (APT) family kinase protein
MKEISTEKIQTIIRKVFPGAEVESCQKLGSGFAYLNYDLRLSNPEMGLTLKVYLRPTEKREPWKETYILKRVAEETGVPVPQVLLFDDSGQLLDTPYAVHTRLPGRSLGALLPEMAEEDIEMVGYEMGRYLARLHVMSGERYGDYFVEDPLASPRERDYTSGQGGLVAEGVRRQSPAKSERGRNSAADFREGRFPGPGEAMPGARRLPRGECEPGGGSRGLPRDGRSRV